MNCIFNIETEWFSNNGFTEEKSDRECKRVYTKRYKSIHLFIDEYNISRVEDSGLFLAYNLSIAQNKTDNYRDLICFMSPGILLKKYYDDYTKT